MQEGVGNINYSGPAAGSGGGGTVTGADQGLIDNANVIELGQIVGTVGDPAAMTTDREIPLPVGSVLYFGHNDGVDSATGITKGGISIFDPANPFLLIFDGSFNLQLDVSGTLIRILFGAVHLVYDTVSGLFGFNAPVVMFNGMGSNIRTIVANQAVTFDDYTIIVDTTAGNITLTIDPAAFINRIFNVKKKTTDANSVTITPVSGLIFANAGGAASYTFSGPGQSAQIQCDGANVYVI